MPQEGQGSPVNILKGHKDWSFFKWSLSLLYHKKKGITSVIKAPIIP